MEERLYVHGQLQDEGIRQAVPSLVTLCIEAIARNKGITTMAVNVLPEDLARSVRTCRKNGSQLNPFQKAARNLFSANEGPEAIVF